MGREGRWAKYANIVRIQEPVMRNKRTKYRRHLPRGTLVAFSSLLHFSPIDRHNTHPATLTFPLPPLVVILQKPPGWPPCLQPLLTHALTNHLQPSLLCTFLAVNTPTAPS